MQTITSNNLQQQTPLIVPVTQPDLTPYQGIVDGAITSLPQLQNEINTANNNQTNLVNLLTEKLNQNTGKQQFLSDQQKLAGVDTETAALDSATAKFNDLSATLSGLSKESLAIPLKLQELVRGQGVTDAGLAPTQTGLLRENAIKALTVSAEADAVASQITNSEKRLQRAKDKAQQAVDLKYKPLEDDILRIQNTLDLNQKYIIDPAEKKRQEKAQIALDERSRLLSEKKENDTKISDMLINASSQNAPQSVLNNAKKLQQSGAKSSDVAIALGQYAGDYYRTELIKNQIATEKAQRAKIIAETNAKNDSVNLYGKPVKVTPTEIQNINDTITSKNSLISLINQYKNNIDTYGTYELFGASAGEKTSLKTNILLGMKELAKTGALDQGTIDVLAGTIPSNEFFSTSANAKQKLETLLNTVTNKADEYINSYRGTTAETDPRTKRAYPQQSAEQQAAAQLYQTLVKVDNNLSKPSTQTTSQLLFNTLYPAKATK